MEPHHKTKCLTLQAISRKLTSLKNKEKNLMWRLIKLEMVKHCGAMRGSTVLREKAQEIVACAFNLVFRKGKSGRTAANTTPVQFQSLQRTGDLRDPRLTWALPDSGPSPLPTSPLNLHISGDW